MAPKKKTPKAPRPAGTRTASARGDYRPIYSVLPDSPEFEVLGLRAGMLLYTVKLSLGPAGIGVLSTDTLCHRSKLQVDEFEAARAELVHHRWILVERRIWWLRNGLRFEPTLSLKNDNHRASVEGYIRGLPKQEIVNRFAYYYGLDLPFPEVPRTMGSPWDEPWDRHGISMGSANGKNPDVDNPGGSASAHDYSASESEKPSNGAPFHGIAMAYPITEPEPEPEPESTSPPSPTPPTEPREDGRATASLNGNGAHPPPTRRELIEAAEPTARAGLNRMRGRDDEGDVFVTPKGATEPQRVGYGLDLVRWRTLAESTESVEPITLARALWFAVDELEMPAPITMALVEERPGALARMVVRAMNAEPSTFDPAALGLPPVVREMPTTPTAAVDPEFERKRAAQKALLAAARATTEL